MVCFVVTQHTESRVSHSVFATPKIRACKAIPIKIRPRSEVFERIFSQDFYLKIIFPSNIRLNSDDLFLAVDNILNKISPKDFLRSNPKNIRINSV